VAIAFESFFQRLRRGEDMVGVVPRAQGIAKGRLVMDTDIGF
jgi:hypothetical protein